MLDVVNRGNTVAVPNFNRATRPLFAAGSDPNPPIDVGDGFLMKRGFVVISCGWQGDVPEIPGLFRMRPPEAREAQGQPLRGRVYSQLQSSGPVEHFLLSDRGHIPYPAADLEEAGAVLTVRDMADGPETVIPRARWRFARVEGGRVVPDATHIHLDGGFDKGRLYQITYTAVGAPVLGLSMAALRDAVSWLKHGDAAVGPPGAGAARMGLRVRALADRAAPAHARPRGPEPGRAGPRGHRRDHRQRGGRDAGRVQPALRSELEGPEPHDGAPVPVHRPAAERSRHGGEGRAPRAARRAREPASRVLHQQLGGVSPRRRLADPHRPRRRAGRRTRPQCPRVSLRRHRARPRRVAAHRHPARRRRCDGHRRAIPAPARRGGLRPAAARLPRPPRPLGRRGRRAAAEPPSPHRRRHRGPAGGARAGLRARARGALPGASRQAPAPRLDEPAAPAGPRVRLARLRRRRRRQRGGRHRPARARGAARHPHRLEPRAIPTSAAPSSSSSSRARRCRFTAPAPRERRRATRARPSRSATPRAPTISSASRSAAVALARAGYLLEEDVELSVAAGGKLWDQFAGPGG